MPYYAPLKKIKLVERKRIVAGIRRLRKQFAEHNFPGKKTSESLILGTWNIRNFDDDRFNYGPRTDESFYYLAEVISRFDVIAIQEICEDLAPLERLMRMLGGSYDYILTDVTHSSLGGNKERLGFIYDSNKVKFKGVAGEIVLPDKMLISEVTDKMRQFSRTPFSVQFQSGWFKFTFSTVHIYFGSNTRNTPQNNRRVQEIDRIASYLAKEAKASDSNHILVGDFNITKTDNHEFNALQEHGFKAVMNRRGSNRDTTRFYDQISFKARKNEVIMLEPERDDRVFQYFDSVYRAEDFETYKPVMLTGIAKKLELAESALAIATSKTAKAKIEKEIKGLNNVKKTDASLKEYYEEWRTFQMSDHLPLWVELGIDFSEAYLDYIDALEV